jgi:hypothetical protein
MNRMTSGGALVALAALLAGPVAGQESYRLSGSRVAVYNLAGQVEVVRGSGSEVVVTLSRGGSDAAELEVETREVDGFDALVIRYPSDDVVYDRGRGGNYSTTLSVRDDGTWGGRMRGGDRVRVRSSGNGLEAHADLRVEVPDGRDIRIMLAVGEASAVGLRGDVELDIGSGRAAVEDVVGDVSVDTGSGGVTVAGVQGEVLVDTGSGSVQVEGVRGPMLSVDTGSGSIDATDITVDAVEVDTGSGSVELARVTARDVLVDTGSGSVDIEMMSTIDRIEVDTGSGGVTLRLPDGIDAEIEADSGSGGIDVDFPMQVRTQRRDYLRGVLGDGRGRITVDTGSGRIRVIRN